MDLTTEYSILFITFKRYSILVRTGVLLRTFCLTLCFITLTDTLADQDVAPVGQDQAINQAQFIQGANGAIALKVEQTKLPEFWGSKTKNSIINFVKRIDNIAKANNWSVKINFINFALALWGSANI